MLILRIPAPLIEFGTAYVPVLIMPSVAPLLIVHEPEPSDPVDPPDE